MDDSKTTGPEASGDEVVSDTGRFAILPEWVLDLDLSDRAVRLYGLLALAADRKTGASFFGKARLSARLRSSPASMKRAMAELLDAGVVTRESRFDAEGRQRSNLYTVRRVNPRGVTGEPLGGVTGEPGEGVTGEPQNQSQREPESEKPERVFSEDVRRLAELLADRIEANGAKRPTITKGGFLDPIRLLLDRDGRTPAQVERAIEWCQAHEFWRANILSGRKLREKYDQMKLQAMRATKPGRQDASTAIAVGQAWAENQRRMTS